MSDEIGLLLRIALAVLGLWYAGSVIRRRRFVVRDVVKPDPRLPTATAPPKAVSSVGSARDPSVVAARWEEVRMWAARIAIGILAAMVMSVLFGTPVWLTEALLIGIGLSLAVYLVSSVVSGWYEGRSGRSR